MKPKRYLSVSGVKTAYESDILSQAFLQQGLYKGRDIIPVLGYQCSTKRINDIEEGGKSSPPLSHLPLIMAHLVRTCATAIHYYTKDRDCLYDEVKQALTHEDMYGSGLVDLLQINMRFPDLRQMEMIRESFPDISVILQLPIPPGETYDPSSMARKVKEYDGLIDYVLIDPSRGIGIQDDLSRHLDLMHAIDGPALTVSLSGGLDADNLDERLKPIRGSFGTHFGIDAQGKLMDKSGDVDIKGAIGYIVRGAYLLKENL